MGYQMEMIVDQIAKCVQNNNEIKSTEEELRQSAANIKRVEVIAEKILKATKDTAKPDMGSVRTGPAKPQPNLKFGVSDADKELCREFFERLKLPTADIQVEVVVAVATGISVALQLAVLSKLKLHRKIVNAKHNMVAYRIEHRTAKGVEIVQGYDEDGEAHAGGRLLHLLQTNNCLNTAVVVTRW
ncbi:uncharacterized protein LOC126911356 [Spodoptera frugiperda]|uniref:Uncharacterized protein LOC126911356 n=1 Tax=Spodoptera frugiperda TaxID=7108 RepID=A0A9R0DVS9_SPOFR|nr:uncharacterized protein LOC126911356 [Spodoptera frugiperda]